MTYSIERSRELFERANRVIPGGVNSPVRAFKAVGGDPLFIASAEGPYVTDVDGNQYIDYVGSWGPMILGHRPEIVTEALREAVEYSTSFGAPTEREVELAELICELVPSMDMVRLVNSGSEATMSAIRLARGFTGRSHVIKCNGCYHGHADSLLVAAGSGVATLGIAGSPGIPEEVASLTASIEFNDIDLMRETVQAIGPDKVAAIIIEPVPGNMGLILPEPEYLQGLRKLCDETGALLIFDEVMCGFRVALGGAQERFGVSADIVTLGKVIGGGLPVGAFGGRRDVMEYLAPMGPVYQAGTLSGNPLATMAGLVALRFLKDNSPYPALEELSSRWRVGLNAAATEHDIPFHALSCGAMLGFFFSKTPVRNYSDAQAADQALFQQFFGAMLKRGVYLAPSAFEAGFLGTTHSDAIIDRTIDCAREVFAELACQSSPK